MILLKEATASQEIPLGQFLDSGDGDTEEGGLTIANTDIHIWKTGATTLAHKNSGGATYISNGVYYCVLDATDTGTLGPLVIFVHVAGALAVRVECLVVPARIYDAYVNDTDSILHANQIAADTDVYQGMIEFTDDNSGANDRYSIVWHKNGQCVTAGITSPTIQVIQVADGADLVGSTAMTQIGATGAYRYVEGANRITNGAQYLIKCQATIDSATRTAERLISRDSTV